MLRADVYRRVGIALSPAAISRLRTCVRVRGSRASSGEALALVLSRLPADLAGKLREGDVAAASERLAQAARAAGFRGRIAETQPVRLRDLVAAMADAIG